MLGLVTSEYLYRSHPDEHEGQLTKTKSLLVSKAILSRRALAMGLGRFVLMSHSEVESGGRQRLSILADAFESVIGAIYLDQGFEKAREFIEHWLLRDSREIVADKRHRNYKSHLQEFVQSTFRTHPVYRIRSQMGPDHSKLFLVEVMVGRRVLGEGRGHNKKEAEQAAARDALEKVEKPGHRREPDRGPREPEAPREPRGGVKEAREAGPSTRTPEHAEAGPSTRTPEHAEAGPSTRTPEHAEAGREGRGSRRGSRGVRGRAGVEAARAEPVQEGPVPPQRTGPRASQEVELEPRPSVYDEDDLEEVGRPEGPLEERRIDPFAMSVSAPEPAPAEPEGDERAPAASWDAASAAPAPEDTGRDEPEGASEFSEEAPEPGVPASESGPPGEPRFGRRRGRRR